MTVGRIVFSGSPWPEGHPVTKFVWSAQQRGSQIWFGFHLQTANYQAERAIEDDETEEFPSDWHTASVWSNYGRCTISSNFWHDGGFAACAASDFTPEYLDGLRLHVDPEPLDLRAPFEQRAFHIYLLGHDSVADHRIQFSKINGTSLFEIIWEGKIALTYAGKYTLAHQFRAELTRIEMPSVLDQLGEQS